ncbi:MAG: hypothetical protein HRT58_21855 [Crocinitomicaceae bacterium]|nr:hypothetical protein [Flavobacteriales bacterium]NQZ38320.1 hypothetical protein [Crocinitomicaceae bacterium]
MKKNHRTNPAVWKSMLRHLPKEEFVQYAMLFGNQVQEAKPNSQAYFYYLTLYTWCKSHYHSHFIQQPTLFK